MDVAWFFEEHGLEPRRVGVAVSGGVDSTALLVALARWTERPFELIALHVDHHLRGEESAGDRAFVEDLCRRLEVPLHVYDAPPDPGRVRETGVENAAREARRAALLEGRRTLELDLIALAHQLDDQAETLLLGLIRGGGTRRLAGIRALDPPWIRPLLGTPREEIEAFLAEGQVTARLDHTNAETRFLRNRLRHEVMPLLRRLQPRVREHLVESARQMSESESLIARIEENWRRDHLRSADDEVVFSINALEEPFLFRRVLLDEAFHRDPAAREISAADLRRISRELSEGKSRIRISRDLEIIRKSDRLLLRRAGAEPEIPQIDLPVTPDTPLEWSLNRQTIVVRSGRHDRESGAWCFALPDSARGELRMRNRREGDRFHPAGSQSPKKLKDYLIDRKIPRELRDRLPLLICDGEIVWIGGGHLARPFVPSAGSTRIYTISVTEQP